MTTVSHCAAILWFIASAALLASAALTYSESAEIKYFHLAGSAVMALLAVRSLRGPKPSTR
jgi:hypothetical protein